MEYSLTLFVTFRFSTGICLNPYSNGILSDQKGVARRQCLC